jgi:hypothetical protein
MSQNESEQGDNFQQREQDLRERELALRVRELEAELQDQQRAETVSTTQRIPVSAQRSRDISLRELWKWLKISGFFVFGLFSVILVINYSVLIVFLLVGSGLSWIAYQLFWNKPLP